MMRAISILSLSTMTSLIVSAAGVKSTFETPHYIWEMPQTWSYEKPGPTGGMDGLVFPATNRSRADGFVVMISEPKGNTPIDVAYLKSRVTSEFLKSRPTEKVRFTKTGRLVGNGFNGPSVEYIGGTKSDPKSVLTIAFTSQSDVHIISYIADKKVFEQKRAEIISAVKNIKVRKGAY
ncbi:MAG: hypothetical protein NDI61_05150 [Bdellovibrionaceae bacterium]|nr:hypothetical protein [Pseudobdellovibrionaceae bacterium]